MHASARVQSSTKIFYVPRGNLSNSKRFFATACTFLLNYFYMFLLNRCATSLYLYDRRVSASILSWNNTFKIINRYSFERSVRGTINFSWQMFVRTSFFCDIDQYHTYDLSILKKENKIIIFKDQIIENSKHN